MSKTISLRDANQGFSRYIRAVQAGAQFIITRDGTPVARLVPIAGERLLSAEQAAAVARAEARMADGWAMGGDPVDRDPLYER